jgi:D-tyrosyl-tRNA(Tyr) deacylase
MRAVVQRVSEACVTVDGAVSGKVSKGFLVLLGVTASDTEKHAEVLAGKITRLRVFRDDQEKMNLSLSDVGGGALVVSQFTLYADTAKGNRPSFIQAAPAAQANALYEYFCGCLRNNGVPVETGVFGADMKVSLVNDGPVTICLDTRDWNI